MTIGLVGVLREPLLRCTRPFRGIAAMAGQNDVVGAVPSWSPARDHMIMRCRGAEAVCAVTLDGGRHREVAVPGESNAQLSSGLLADGVPHERLTAFGDCLRRGLLSGQLRSVRGGQRAMRPASLRGADVCPFLGRFDPSLMDGADLGARLCGGRSSEVSKARLLAGFGRMVRPLEHRKPPCTRLGRERSVQATAPLSPRQLYRLVAA